jgi:nucleoside-diphosphate-sugar epimerase
MNAKPQVLVTGATGFLGGALLACLRDHGWDVIGAGRNIAAGERLKAQGFTFYAADLSRHDAAFDEMAAALAPGCCIAHCAALSSPWGKLADFKAANIQATQNMLELAKVKTASRFVHISTPAVHFEYALQRGLVETSPWSVKPANHYVATKRAGEMLVKEAINADLPAIILRPKALFGPGDTTLLPRVMKLARKGVFPRFGGDVELDLTWIEDACEAARLALAAPRAGGTYFITSGQPLSRDLVFTTLFAASGFSVRQVNVPRPLALGLGSAMEAVSKLLTFSKWEPPLTRYSVGTLAYGQTLDIIAARNDLGYGPKTDVLEKLRLCGQLYRETR